MSNTVQRHSCHRDEVEISYLEWTNKNHANLEPLLLLHGLTKPLAIPSLLIQPSEGINRTPWQLKPYRQYLSNLEIKQLVGNHWLFLVNPEPFNRQVAEFLDRQTKEINVSDR